MLSLGFAAVLAAAVALPAAARPTLSADLFYDAGLPAYASFAIVDPPLAPGTDALAYDRTRRVVEETLIEKGYAESPKAELAVHLRVESHEKADMKSGGAYGARTAVYRYTEARATIEVYDARTRIALWRGQAIDALDQKMSEPAAVTLLMARFPDHASPARAALASEDASANGAPSPRARPRSSATRPGSDSPCCRRRAHGSAGRSAPETPAD